MVWFQAHCEQGRIRHLLQRNKQYWHLCIKTHHRWILDSQNIVTNVNSKLQGVSFKNIAVPANGSVTLSINGTKAYFFTSGNNGALMGGVYTVSTSSTGIAAVSSIHENNKFNFDASTNYKLTVSNTQGSNASLIIMLLAGTVSVDS